MATKVKRQQLNMTMAVLSLSTNASLAASGAFVPLDTATIDTGGEISTSGNRWVASQNGYAVAHLLVHLDATLDGEYYQLKLFKNGSEFGHVYIPGKSGYFNSLQGTWIVPVVVGDYLQMNMYNQSVQVAQGNNTFMSIQAFY